MKFLNPLIKKQQHALWWRRLLETVQPKLPYIGLLGTPFRLSLTNTAQHLGEDRRQIIEDDRTEWMTPKVKPEEKPKREQAFSRKALPAGSPVKWWSYLNFSFGNLYSNGEFRGLGMKISRNFDAVAGSIRLNWWLQPKRKGR